jgi:CheY-like chemotaxis protein
MSDCNIVMLLVEDNPADVVFFTEALANAGVPVCLHAVDNGGDAMAFLRRQGQFVGAPLVDVVVLDLNVPVLSGREVLQSMRADPALHLVPLVILTTSDSEADIVSLYTPGRCRYEVKTSDFGELTAMAAKAHAMGLSFRDSANH